MNKSRQRRRKENMMQTTLEQAANGAADELKQMKERPEKLEKEKDTLQAKREAAARTVWAGGSLQPPPHPRRFVQGQ